MSDIKNLKPTAVWNYFHEITQIPHPSKMEQKMVDYVTAFGKKLGLETIVDKTGNVIIRKPATKGMENRQGIILQSHLDMVPQKNNDTVHDFEKDPLKPYIDGEWVKAKGTTLGADNGIGVAATMAVLASSEFPHGQVEALFTVDEETGMTGANNLEAGKLTGTIMINLDSEDEGELYVGCAGGVNVSAMRDYKEVTTPAGLKAYKVVIKGLKGGHSGMDINMGRANANKLLFRFLMQAEADYKIHVAEAMGGDLRNAIPREGHAVVCLPADKSGAFETFVKNYEKVYRNEFAETEPDLAFSAENVNLPAKVMDTTDQYRIIRSVYVCPNGVMRMSASMPGLVETSNNLAIVKCAAGRFSAMNLTRSSVDSAKDAAAWKIAAGFHLADAEVKLDGGYPGWKPNMSSAILKSMQNVYKKMYNVVPEIKAVHAGLECGIILGVYPGLDVISFGPTIRHPHSPDEKVNIATVQKFWDFLVETLKSAPLK
ncbi:MAG: aminoacyl-histidine dipeptidase [Bacteroidales bacterium]|nr:aminoacyl-histidine dipeptidase [Bacteroidales bacterium]